MSPKSCLDPTQASPKVGCGLQNPGQMCSSLSWQGCWAEHSHALAQQMSLLICVTSSLSSQGIMNWGLHKDRSLFQLCLSLFPVKTPLPLHSSLTSAMFRSRVETFAALQQVGFWISGVLPEHQPDPSCLGAVPGSGMGHLATCANWSCIFSSFLPLVFVFFTSLHLLFWQWAQALGKKNENKTKFFNYSALQYTS